MKFVPFCVVSALVLGVPVARCDAQPLDLSAPVAPAPVLLMTPGEFREGVSRLNKQGDWAALLQLGRERAGAQPDDYWVAYAQARAAYMLGDLDLAIAQYQKMAVLDPAEVADDKPWLDTLLTARRNFPNLQLQPLQYVQGDAARESEQWTRKGAALLKAKRYDEIERTTAALQRSNKANIQGVPHLSAFFDGLSVSKDVGAQKVRIAAWKAARPASNLARIASLAMWTEIAANARGNGYASSITPDMEKRMGAALDRGAQTIQSLPKSAFNSPLAFEAVLRWGLLASQPRAFFDDFFQEATAKFPGYLPLYTQRAHALLPRWFGIPGEWEAMTKKRADQIGGENGDVFYARVVWSQSHLVLYLPEESRFDYGRVRRGLEFLQKRQPDSISVASARLEMAFDSKDWATAKQVLAAPRGHLLDNSWWLWQTPGNKAFFAEQRIAILGDATSRYTYERSSAGV